MDKRVAVSMQVSNTKVKPHPKCVLLGPFLSQINKTLKNLEGSERWSFFIRFDCQIM